MMIIYLSVMVGWERWDMVRLLAFISLLQLIDWQIEVAVFAGGTMDMSKYEILLGGMHCRCRGIMRKVILSVIQQAVLKVQLTGL